MPHTNFQFPIRALLLLMCLVAAYMAGWAARGLADRHTVAEPSRASMPIRQDLLVVIDKVTASMPDDPGRLAVLDEIRRDIKN